MSTFVKVLAVVGTLTVAVVIDAFVLRAESPLPEVQGFGAETVGGTGGRVVSVTSLDDDGPGTLRWALEDLDEPRIVHFDVQGTIHLEDQIQINGYASVLGHTAPGPLTITGSRLRVVGSEVILTGLRIRPGDGTGNNPDDRDAISIGKRDVPIRNVVIHGNSLTWGIDENMAVWGDVQDVTISNNIIAEALNESLHSKGAHSMGLLIGGGDAARISVIGNLLASNAHRNPAINNESQQIEVVNNFVYNWYVHGLSGGGSTIHAVGNVYIPGPDSVVQEAFDFRNGGDQTPLVYLEDNVAMIRPERDEGLSETPLFAGSDIDILPAADVERYVLGTAGARTPDLDHVDTAIVESIVNRAGQIIDTPSESVSLVYPAKSISPQN